MVIFVDLMRAFTLFTITLWIYNFISGDKKEVPTMFVFHTWCLEEQIEKKKLNLV